eukprot:scaffold508857_cov19-Prasinocladus_malaysianus.AAC.1
MSSCNAMNADGQHHLYTGSTEFTPYQKAAHSCWWEKLLAPLCISSRPNLIDVTGCQTTTSHGADCFSAGGPCRPEKSFSLSVADIILGAVG